MESNLSFFSLPFVDNADVDFSKIKGEECDYDDLHPTLPSHGSLLGAEDVLAHFLSGDELLEEPNLNGPTTLHCEICRKQFDNAKKYYGHLRVHSKDSLWICDKCPNKKFSTKQQLMKHSLTHKPLERVWQCPQCDMSFEAMWRLQQHLFAKHLDYRPHKCDRCDISFHKLSDLNKHKDIHDDIKNHECKICKVKFRDASNLKRHMLSHGKEKPYPCPGCGNRYKQLASMKRHSGRCAMVKHIPDPTDKTIRKNYCRVCGMTFQYKSALLEHCVRQHSDNPPPDSSDIPKENKCNKLHVGTTRPLNISSSRAVNIDTNRHLNLDTNVQLNIYSNRQLNIDPSRQLGTDINRQLSMDPTRQLNMDPNRQLNIDSNRQLNIDLNRQLNVDPNRPLNIDPNRQLSTDATRQLNMDPNRQLNIDANRTVDNIVDDILSAEDDYLIRNSMSNQILNYNPAETENLMPIELLKEMNQMHILDDELLYNDIDFDSFQTMCNTNDMDYTERNELLFDIADDRSIDQDIMNALCQVKGDNLPDVLLNEAEILNTNEKVNDFLVNPSVSVNECATIFESDVDLEASTNLAANLNQLIGENTVQYISTEHDDTFIISLNSEIDAEQLTDMLNIGMAPEESNKNNVKDTVETAQPRAVTIKNVPETENITGGPVETIVIKVGDAVGKENIDSTKLEKPKVEKKPKNKILYYCRKCNKIFNRKNNYTSHRATHDTSLSQYKCRVCGERFGYRSTLNKHMKKLHTPLIMAAHECTRCDKTYPAAWMLKRHMGRDHELDLRFECVEKGCGKKFYTQRDLDVHNKFHKDERPHKCDICKRGFYVLSHLNRHIRKTDCTKFAKKADFTMR